jgi:uracil-DNA glycosylase family 4
MRILGEPVANQFPSMDWSGGRIAIIGQSPGADEDSTGVPFVGRAGNILDGALGGSGVPRRACFVGNVCQRRPAENDFDRLDWNGPEVQEGIARLREDLERFRPDIVLCLGNETLHLFKNGNRAVRKVWRQGRQESDWESRVGDWRGSLFESNFLRPELGPETSLNRFTGPSYEAAVTEARPLVGSLKCLAAYHPAAVAREWGLQGYYRALAGVGDFERLREEARKPGLWLPERRIGIVGVNVGLEDGLAILGQMAREERPVAFDSEGGVGNITSLSFSRRADRALVVPLARVSGESIWTEDEEVRIWEAVRGLIESPVTPKIAQNGAVHDFYILAWTYGIVVRNYAHDTMNCFWESFAELRKGLATQASLLTRQPFYKPDKDDEEGGQRLSFKDDHDFWTYSGIDAAVTFECWEREMELLDQRQREHYAWNMRFMPRVLYMELRGMRVCQERVEETKALAAVEAKRLQEMIDREDQTSERGRERAEALRVLREGSEAEVAGLFLKRLGGKAPKVKGEVVVERWQPMRWNGKKWVRAGKLRSVLPDNATREISIEAWGEVPIAAQLIDGYLWGFGDALTWLKPMPKTVSKLLPFTPTHVKEVEPFVLKSREEDWAEVKRLWKEWKNEKKTIEAEHESTTILEDRSSDGEGTGTAVGAGTVSTGEAIDTGTVERAYPTRDVSTRREPSAFLSPLGLSINVGSNAEDGDTQKFLYETCGLPRIFEHRKTGRLSRESESDTRKRLAGEKVQVPAGKKVTTSAPAINKLYAETQDQRVLWVRQQREARKVGSDLSLALDEDGRVRCGITMVKDTGRMAASKTAAGTGANLMAWARDLRRVCVADPGREMGRYDLSGADSWTVAAELTRLGDPTMLEDLKFGLKPARILCMAYQHGETANRVGREELRKLIRATTTESWLYDGAKASCHGTSYGAGWQTIKDTVLKNSLKDLPLVLAEAKPVVLSKKQIEVFQGGFLARYKIKLWHEREGREMVEQGYIKTTSGNVRRFYGLKAEWDSTRNRKVPCHETLKEWLAHKPQYWTTRALKLALEKLWDDPENRLEDGGLRVEPLLCVHDSLDMQWEVEERAWALEKAPEWFTNELEIVEGVRVVIPVEGKTGTDWGME